MKKSDFGMEIIRVDNGYRLRYPNPEMAEVGGLMIPFIESVIEDDDDDGLKSGEQLLWAVIEIMGIGGGRHDAERLTITREPGEKYEGSKGRKKNE